MKPVRTAAVMPAATAILFAYSLLLRIAPCWVLFFVVSSIAWPIWRGQSEYALSLIAGALLVKAGADAALAQAAASLMVKARGL